MINSSLFQNSIEPFIILNEIEVVDYNPAFQKLLHLQPKSINNLQFSTLLPHEQADGTLSEKLLLEIIERTHRKGNIKENILFVNGKGEKVGVNVQFTSFTSDSQMRMVFGICRFLHKADHNLSCPLETFGKRVDRSNGKFMGFQSEGNGALLVDVENPSKNKEFFGQSEVNFKVLAEATPSVIMQFDTSFRHTYVNSKIQDLTGIPAGEFIGKTHEELNFPLALVDLFRGCLQEVMDKKVESSKEFRLPNGKCADWHLVPVLDDNKEVKSIITSVHDITSLKNIEEEVRQAKERLTDAMKMAQLSTWEYDLNCRKMILSTTYREIFSIQSKRKITGEFLLEKYVHPDDRHLILDVFNEAMESKVADYKNYFEYRGIKQGQTIHILTSLRVIKNELGIITKCYGTAQDITDIRKNEQELEAYKMGLERLVEERTKELQNSESKLNDALKLVSLGTWEFDLKSQKFLIGDEVVNMISLKRDKTLGNVFTVQEFIKYLHPDDWPELQISSANILKVKEPDFVDYLECRIVRPNGEIRNLYISLKIIFDDNGRHLKHFGTIQDITNIRSTEAEKERLIAISEATSDIIAITCKKGGIFYLNKAGKSFFGVEQNVELSYLNINTLQISKKYKVLKKVGIAQAIRKGIWSGENIIVGADGVGIPVSQVIIAHQSGNGNVDCFSTILRNISRQKNIEQDLLYKNNELDTFVYRASHDLRGPIASLLGLHTIIKYEISDPTSLKYFEMYNQQIARLNNIVISLIEISRIKDREANKILIDFDLIIKECIDSFQNLPNFSNIHFKINIDAGLNFKSDLSIVTTIVQNLIENAIKYSKPDERSVVKIDVRALTGSLSIKVADSGIGIDGSIQGKIFNMFFRGTEQGMGSGLGLYILKNAVDKLKGQIKLDSIVNKGTTFEILIPSP